mgnify:CR=1 FL=1
MEQEQIEEFGISIYEFDDCHFVKIHSERQKSIVDLTLYNICENIYSDLGHQEDWELFIDLYKKLSEKVGREKVDRTITL